ncbi:DUF2510 domain-containing protein [Occultella glacieicola]|uniref:DUF2510 domain-containing protein n=1 Tax=Occultella glacieicola TaxID=2518684 RepID=A0ABY2E295_9MICO|nr:DUF2510 domain-containing protein [Occultella glacieicola]TDE92712.1 DUF2510 domain-containing protein [Occultella glacieicola]
MSATAGWFPDPEGQDRLRYWDGSAWTENYAPKPGAADAATAATPAVGAYGVATGAPAAPAAPSTPAPAVPSGGYGQGSAPGVPPAAQPGAAGPYGQPAVPGPYGQPAASGGYGQPGAGYGGGYGTPGGPRKNNTGLIVAIVAVVVLVLGVAGFFGYRALNPDDPAPTAGPTPGPTDGPTEVADPPTTDPVVGPTDAPTGDMPEMVQTLTIGTAATGSFPADGSWGALLPVSTPGVYLLHGVADGGEDLQLTVFDEELNAISFIDDVPQGGDGLQPNSLNPLLPIYLDAGQYAVVITEYAGAAASFQVLAEDLTAIPELPQDVDVDISMEAGNVWMNYVVVDAAGSLTIDARTTNGADLLMTVISPLGGWISNDDRGADIAAQVGGDSYDPYLEEAVDPGVYILMMSEYADGAGAAVISVNVT